MDNQRILLYAALGFVLLLLWQNWQLQYGPPPPQVQSSTPEMKIGKPASKADISIPTAQPAGLAPTSEPMSSSTKIKVETDLLSVEIDSRGGTISLVKLKQYPVSIDDQDTPFTLISDDPLRFFVVQTGLQSVAGEAPTHQVQFTYAKTEYSLTDENPEIRVPLTWTSKTGVKVSKTIVLRKNSYVINIEYQIENGSDETFVVNQYRQLQRKPITDDETQRFIYNYIGGIVSTPEDPYSKLDFGDMEDADLDQQVKEGWEAIIQHYFVGAIVPNTGEVNTFYSKALRSPKRYILGMFSEAQSIDAGQSGEFNMTTYLGPKDQERLSVVAEKLNLVVDFGWLTILANPIFWLLKKIHSFVGNWGWSIIKTRNREAKAGRFCLKLLQLDAPGPPPCNITRVSPSPASL